MLSATATFVLAAAAHASPVPGTAPSRDAAVAASRPSPIATPAQRSASQGLYRQGRQFLDRRGPRDFAQAIALFDQAIAADPTNAAPWAGKAVAHVLERANFVKPAAESWRRARHAAQQAVALGPSLADTYAAKGLVALNADWNFAEAERAYRHALQLDPNHGQALQWLAELTLLTGRYRESLAYIEKAIAGHPDSPLLLGVHGYILACSGQLDAAQARLQEAVQLGPPFAWIHEELARLAELEGDVRGAMDIRREEMRRRGVGRAELARLDDAMALHGLRGFYLWRSDWAVQKPGFSNVAPELAAETLAALGRHTEARAILAATAQDSGESLLHMLVRSPAFRQQPYRDMAREFGLTALVIPPGRESPSGPR